MECNNENIDEFNHFCISDVIVLNLNGSWGCGFLLKTKSDLKQNQVFLFSINVFTEKGKT